MFITPRPSYRMSDDAMRTARVNSYARANAKSVAVKYGLFTLFFAREDDAF
jgi:hypothetical protein